jgi:preprotein translocase subunit YajC
VHTAPTLALLSPLAQDGGGLLSFLPFIIVFVIFWMLVFRPQSKERKAREEKIKSLKKHDRVVTNAGIYGTVVALDTDTVTLRVDEKNNVRIVFSRAAVWQVNPEGPTPTPAEDAPAPLEQGAPR